MTSLPTDAPRSRHKCLKSSIALLTAVMRDPMSSDICYWRLRTAMTCLDTECASIPSPSKFASSQHELLRAAIRFVTTYRTISEHEAMSSKFRLCRCDLKKKEIHDLHKPCALFVSIHPSSRRESDFMVPPPYREKTFSLFQMIASNTIHMSISNLSFNKFHGTKKLSDGTTVTGKWPQDEDDLFPFGYERSIIAFNMLARANHTKSLYFPFTLVAALCLFDDGFAQELFKVERHTLKYDLALATPLSILQDLMDAPISSRRPGGSFEDGVKQIFLMLHFMVMKCAPEVPFILTQNKAAQIINRLSPIVAKGGPMLDNARTNLALLDTFLPNNFDLDWDTGNVQIKNVDSTQKRLDSLVSQQFDNAQNAWVRIKEVPKVGCLAVNCPTVDRASSSMPACAKCNFVRYCGRECQRDSWKHPTHPHKVLCAKICQLRETIGPTEWTRLFSIELNTFDVFQEICKAKNVDPNLVSEIGHVLTTLNTQKIKLGSDRPDELFNQRFNKE